MSTVLEHRLPRISGAGWRPWAALLPGLLLLYVPTYTDLAHGLWREEAYAHGPIVLALFAFLLWRHRATLLDESLAPAPVAGGLLLGAGLAVYLLGRALALPLFEVASHLPVIAGAVLLLRGFSGLRQLAFPILFLAFLVPLPGFVLEAATGPLKEGVSAAVAWLLALAGHAVERNGVVLLVDGHELLVADACSGLNSVMSLAALGLIYAHASGRRMGPAAARLAIALVPVAFAANVLRVLALSLIAVHWGDAAARGTLHDAIGLTAFAAAFGLLVLVIDGVRLNFTPAAGPFAGRAWPAAKSNLAPLCVAFAMALTAAAAPALRPVAGGDAPDLERLIPASFGDWRLDPEEAPAAIAPDVQANLDRLYGQVVARTYVNSRGDRIMLTVAHGGDQSDALKAHRQEVCYRAQGFDIRGLAHERFAVAGREIPVTRMLAVRGERSEPVTYWFTMGDRVVGGRLERLRVQVRDGLAGRIPDGMLVRVSSLSNDPRSAFAAQDAFLGAIVAAVPQSEAARLVGRG